MVPVIHVGLHSAVDLPLSGPGDVDDSLDNLLNELDQDRPKSTPSGKAVKPPTSSPAGQKKEELGKNNIQKSS